MKRQLFICLLFCIGIYSNAQEIIEKPKQSNHYKKRVEITKVELTNNETILHITFKKNKNDSILIPKTIYITDENSSEKKFVIKSKGVVLEKKISFLEKDEILCQLIFPPLDQSVNAIDLLVEQKPIGTWKGQKRRNSRLAYQVVIRPFNEITKKDNAFTKISYKDAFIKAEKENKNVLLYFTAPWCGPCHWMEKHMLNDPEINTLIKENYIPVKINTDTQKGGQLYNLYNKGGIPLYVLLTPENKLLKKQMGSSKKDVFFEFLTPDKTISPTALEKLKPKKTYIDPSIGLRLGFVNNTFTKISLNSRTGFTADLFYSKEINDFYLFRTGIGFNSKGSKNFSVNYIKFPLEFGIKILNGSLINTQGGVRAIISPYYALGLNKKIVA